MALTLTCLPCDAMLFGERDRDNFILDVTLFFYFNHFFSFVFFFPILFSYFSRIGNGQANIVGCAVMGSFAVIVPIDHYIGSSLKYMIVNVIRRATVRGFGRAVLDPPYQDNGEPISINWLTGLLIRLPACSRHCSEYIYSCCLRCGPISNLFLMRNLKCCGHIGILIMQSAPRRLISLLIK